jgi:hypothetical protein
MMIMMIYKGFIFRDINFALEEDMGCIYETWQGKKKKLIIVSVIQDVI